MSEPTEADKELALDLVDAVREARTLTERTEARMAIAAALAAERAKARAPFLVLSVEMNMDGTPAVRHYANRIRRLAEDS